MVENETHDFDQQRTGQDPDQTLKEENDASSQLYQYFVHDNCLYLKCPVKGKEFPELKLLCNFVPCIERQIAYNDGEKVEIKLEVCARMQNGSDCPPVIISAEELDGMKWVTKNWGAECIMEVGAKVKDHIRHMIQCTACKAEKTTVYTVTGWKEINGAYHFLMPGDETQTVKLQNKMSGYGMQREYEDYDLAVAASFLQETLASKKILYPLIAFVFMSPLNSFLREAKCEPKTVLMLVGKSGSKKSTLSALMLSFFGNFTATSLPLSFKDTANSIMHHAFSLKDVLTCIDDFHPSGKADEQNMKNTMQMILRSYGDRVGRGRLNEKSEALEACLLIKQSYRVAKVDSSLRQSGIVEELERLKRKRYRLTELYTDDEITKAEYSEQRQKIDKSMDVLNEQLRAIRLEEGTERINPEPAWDKIMESLNAMTEFSKPALNADFVKKYVSRIEVVSNSHFRWYLNLDGSRETLFDCVVNGTKKNPVIIIDGDGPDKGRLLRKNKTILDKWTNAEYNPNCTYVTILLFELKKALKSKDSSLLTALHRQLSVAGRTNLYFRFTIDFDEALKYRKEHGQYLRNNAYDPITVEVFI